MCFYFIQSKPASAETDFELAGTLVQKGQPVTNQLNIQKAPIAAPGIFINRAAFGLQRVLEFDEDTSFRDLVKLEKFQDEYLQELGRRGLELIASDSNSGLLFYLKSGLDTASMELGFLSSRHKNFVTSHYNAFTWLQKIQRNNQQ